MAKQTQHMYLYMNMRGLHIDIAKDAGTFYNNDIQYAHLNAS